ncbi:MAG: PIN domain-containing protein [candidate division KSB1 bacterium]|nr:PIN domain-containing protein [candidate division KSB1 bacterium]
MFLVDTNVWVELLLEQEKASEVRRFLQAIEPRLLSMTEFSLYSIGVILTPLKKDDVFEDFLSDTIEDSGVARVRLDTEDLKQLLAVRQQFEIDFDDAYQYVAAEKYDLTIVSFDADFDRTDRGKKTPAEILEG